MQLRTVWQSGSSDPENGNHFATISEWWSGLNSKEITWKQRLIPAAGDVSELNWEAQRFDEKFVLASPQVRGTTLYWQKPDSPQERNTTVARLELDHLRQQLYIFPQSQKELVIRVGIPEVVYQTLELKSPQIQGMATGGNYVLSFRDASQQVEVKVTLSPAELEQLKQIS